MAKTFKVLPTDERFRRLTAQQIQWLYYDANPDEAEAELRVFSDPEFDEWEKDPDAPIDPTIAERWEDVED